MALVLSGQGERSSPLLRKARQYTTHLVISLVLAGFLWLLALPLRNFSRRTYFSENAMMPGQVELSFGTSEHLAAMNSLRQTWKSAGASKRGPELLAAFTDLGLDSELTWVEGGCAVHGIVRAPRSDGVEALVIVAAGQGDNRTNSEAVGLLGGLALYAAEQTYWAKDVIFLATDAGEIGVQEWLRAYHGEQGRMLERSGSIQAALALELPEGDGKMVGGLALHFEGRGGELPNLDFLNIVQYMARLEHIPAYLHGLSEPPSGSSAIEKYWSALRQLLLQARGQAVGAATGVHMQFLSYGIDALTIHGIERVGSRYAKSVVSVGRLTEATLRSLNNLLERFHQSFFYYLLPENGRFISIANYVPATVLFAAALMIHAMLLWYLQGPESLRSEDPKSRIERMSAYHSFLRSTLPTSFAVILRVHALGALLMAVPLAVPQTVISDSTATAFLFTAFLASISLVLHLSSSLWDAITQSKQPMVDWRQLKALVSVYVACIVACLSVMNFSMAIGMFVVSGLPLLFTRMFCTPTRLQRAFMVAMLLLFSPVSVMAIVRYFLEIDSTVVISGQFVELGWFRLLLRDFSQFGSLIYPLLFLVYWPVNLICMVVTLMP